MALALAALDERLLIKLLKALDALAAPLVSELLALDMAEVGTPVGVDVGSTMVGKVSVGASLTSTEVVPGRDGPIEILR